MVTYEPFWCMSIVGSVLAAPLTAAAPRLSTISAVRLRFAAGGCRDPAAQGVVCRYPADAVLAPRSSCMVRYFAGSWVTSMSVNPARVIMACASAAVHRRSP